MLYLRKQEEARISDALDQQRFSNVVVAEPATVPYAAQGRWLFAVLLGGLKPEGLSSLETNVIVTEILDAARQSAATGKTIRLGESH